MSDLEATQLTHLERAKERGHFDQATIHQILDSTPLCHVGYNVDNQPIVMPTIHWRNENFVFWHGSRISRTMLESEGARVCLTVTHLDGLVLARSAFHHSANYRSVLVFGEPEAVTDKTEKEALLKLMIDKMMPGRWETLRKITSKELAATTVLRLPITEASAKIRTGGPNDLDEDLNQQVWAGVLPFSITTDEPIPCDHNATNQQEPDHLRSYQIGK